MAHQFGQVVHNSQCLNTFNYCRITVGKISVAQPGNVTIAVESFGFYLGGEVYDRVAKMWNIDQDGFMECVHNVNITFTLGELDVVLMPEDFMYIGDGGKWCRFNGQRSDGEQSGFVLKNFF